MAKITSVGTPGLRFTALTSEGEQPRNETSPECVSPI
jgi:hypothetical protein